MLSSNFGVEIEFTGITRSDAAKVVADCLSGIVEQTGDHYDTYLVTAPDGRKWKLMSDASLDAQMKSEGKIVQADTQYRVELVTPILTYYNDIETLQGLVRQLKKAGGFTNSTCGIHVHLDGSNHTPRSLWNFVNLVASRNDLFYKALQIPYERMQYCQQMDLYMVHQLNQKKPRTFEGIERIWYDGYSESKFHRYHDSRYHFLNLHSFFHGNHTVELRGFNSTLHAGIVRAYIVFALAMNHQALTQKRANYRRVQSDNEKFAMRVYLVRIGLSGDEFKSCRKHLYEHLSGNSAWRYGSKENCHSRRKTTEEFNEQNKKEV